MKIIPLYLPQFHTIPENDKWWGKGFTEWVNVKAAKPLFEGHRQPRVPLDRRYYDLSDVETLKWQCKTAREHGIYGFSFYHYWFNGHLLLEKPMEMLLDHPEIDINYCICWANHDWTNSWKADRKNMDILIAHDFDDEDDWRRHFEYMLKFFRDPRYIKEDNKPLLTIYIPQIIGKLNKMLDLWNALARENGFDGMTYLYQCAPAFLDKSWDRSRFSYGIQFEPDYAIQTVLNARSAKLYSWIVHYSHRIKKFLHIRKSLSFVKGGTDAAQMYDYDKVWSAILHDVKGGSGLIPSAYVDWDNTPRKGVRGSVHRGANPESFKKYFKELLLKARNEYDTDYIFVFAWNEWAEGGYLEPDEDYGFGNLDAISEALKETGEYETCSKMP